ncbi:hypothetical protein VSR01_25210 [Actinacidiphila sp. DG2A-62]|jgi:hypothetical protein|uniref:hypothetical protein n=1 Tax=Actinacidiphila sp. DG2A-62 TaxID=3108821 RepID=UPI002DBEBB94|nr:hypothetical protein [Actinacidiphila sp. DG2A-62]MEC3996627.1 hypothetical protein [Actinacidiphila sp. DG2A-62]
MASLRTAFALTLTAAAAVIVPAASASAASAPADAGPLPGTAVGDALPLDAVPLDAVPTQSVTGALADGIGPVKHLTLDPLSNTGVDPLDNGVGSQIADFKPVSTGLVTDPITHGGSLATLPVISTVTALLPG